MPQYPKYRVHQEGRVLGPRGGILKMDQNGQVALRKSGKTYKKRVSHLMLLAFHPEIEPLETVDHIDEDYTNNHLSNLQWSTRPDNSSKSIKLRPRNSGPKQSKRVWLLDGKNGQRLHEFSSRTQAARETGISGANISQSARSYGRNSAGGKYFSYAREDETDLPGEVWVTSDELDRHQKQVGKPDDRKVKVSTKGRIRSRRGVKRKGTQQRGGKWRETNNYKDHALIYMGFYNKPAPRKDERDEQGRFLRICHDDTAPLDEDGCYRNYPEDLRIDTQHANMVEYHEAKRMRKETTI